MTVQRNAWRLGDRPPLPTTPVVDITTVAGTDRLGIELYSLHSNQVPQHLTDLASQGRAKHHWHPQAGDHPRLPHPLPAGMHVDVGLSPTVLDDHSEQRGWREHHDFIRHRSPPQFG